MKFLLFLAAVCVAICAGLQTEISKSSPIPCVRDLGAEVRGVFASKCAACHGADVAKPQGRFGYVLDLQRVASNPELVIPWHPSESELWSLVQHNEMPPSGSLTTQQKEIIREWIAAGAPQASSTRKNRQQPASGKGEN